MSKTLTKQVEEMVDKKIRLAGLAADMLATVQLNVERGHIVAVNDVARSNLIKIIASWRKQLQSLGGSGGSCERQPARAGERTMSRTAYTKRPAAKRFDEMPVQEYTALTAVKKLAVLASEWDDAEPTQRHYLEGRMIEVTAGMEEHPEWYDHNCLCDLCLSYAN